MSHRARPKRRWLTGVIDPIKQSFSEFLALPTYIIIIFLALGAGSYMLDRANPHWLHPLHSLLEGYLFGGPSATSNLLSTIATGLITVASITISLLLIALQQSAANLTTQILDQFLRRRINQTYFGFFVGLALYSLVTLATVSNSFNPIYGATLAFLLMVVALYLLIILLYTTINQMRPLNIVEAIHDHILAAREGQLDWIRKTRRSSSYNGHTAALVKAEEEGFVTRMDVDAMGRAAQQHLPDDAEITLNIVVGSYVAFQDLIATVKTKTETNQDLGELIRIVRDAVLLERQRDIATDAGYGVEQLARIGWTSISSAKSNIAPGLLVLYALRDVLARWSAEQKEEKGERDAKPWPIVYEDDAIERLLDAFESLAIVSSESMQYQIFAEVLRGFVIMYPRLVPEHRPRVEDLLGRVLSAMGDHVLARELDAALSDLAQVMMSYDRMETASIIQGAQRDLSRSVNKLNSRSSRVPG